MQVLLPSLCVIAVLAVAVGLAVRSLVRSHKAGGSCASCASCGGGCSGCSGCGSCPPKK